MTPEGRNVRPPAEARQLCSSIALPARSPAGAVNAGAIDIGQFLQELPFEPAVAVRQLSRSVARYLLLCRPRD
jgi:hypothetical protein